jgi:MFS family permease
MIERDRKDTYYKQNVFGISCVEFFWGLGLPIVIESTFLQLFLKKLGASSFAIGLIPAFFFIGTSVFALFSSYLTSDLVLKRNAVILLHLVSAFSLLLFSTFLYVFGEIALILVVFFICYAVFSVCVGMTLPVWQNYLAKIFTEEKLVSGLSFMMIAQNGAKLLSSFLIVKVVDTYAFSLNSSALIFGSVGFLFFLGSLFFYLTREVLHPHEVEAVSKGKKESFFRHTFNSIHQIVRNRNFLFFLGGDFEAFVVITVISFYANYATTYCGIDNAVAAGFFVGFIYLGAICTNLFLGMLGLLSLKNKYILSKFLSISAILLIISFDSYWSFFLASFLLGTSKGTRMIVVTAAVKRLSGLHDSTSYYAVGPILTLPFALILPLAFGKFLDIFSDLQADSYKIAFGIAIVLILGTLLSILNTNFENPVG